jgi:hypothetical protein
MHQLDVQWQLFKLAEEDNMEERKKYPIGRPKKGEVRPPKPAPQYLYGKGKERPQMWVIGSDAGSYKHSMYHPWQKAKAQAVFRGEVWSLSFEDFYELWKNDWDNRGRDSTNVCMTREDYDGEWSKENTILMTRTEHLKRQNRHRSKPATKTVAKKSAPRAPTFAYAKLKKA